MQRARARLIITKDLEKAVVVATDVETDIRTADVDAGLQTVPFIIQDVVNDLPAVAVSELSLLGPGTRTYEISFYRNPPRGLQTLMAIWRFLLLFPLVAALGSPPASSYLTCWP